MLFIKYVVEPTAKCLAYKVLKTRIKSHSYANARKKSSADAKAECTGLVYQLHHFRYESNISAAGNHINFFIRQNLHLIPSKKAHIG